MTDNFNLHLKKFDMRSIKDDSVIALIGKRETGKSFLAKDILYYKKNFPIGIVISATENANKFYGDFVPKQYIYEEYDKKIIKNIIKSQTTSVQNKKQMEQDHNGNCHYDSRFFLIMDDCLYDTKWSKDKEIRRVFMNGRHYDILFIIIMQYPLGIPPNLRCNIDYTFILRENITSNRKRIYEHYAGMFPDFPIFCQVMDACTENYECLVIHNNAKSNKLEDQVFWYKASNHENFLMGHSSLWNESNNYVIDDSNDNDLISELSNSRKKNKITVKKKI